jgi:60 kDa SS-A/Ro ribonucleoprotein
LSKLNAKPWKSTIFTHAGGPARKESLHPKIALRRYVLACMLWEDEFYEGGSNIAERIYQLALTRPADEVAALAREARGVFNLRHVPLVLLSALSVVGKGSSIVSDAVRDVLQRADEPAELLQVMAKLQGQKSIRKVMTHGVRRGIAKAMTKFDDYQLAKYDRDSAVRLRDVALLTHVPGSLSRASDSITKIVQKEKLPAPDTWEVALSGGADKREAFTRLLQEGKLPYLALLRNLRNMVQAGVSPELIRSAIVLRRGGHRVLPFRYIAAARAAPMYEPELDWAMQQAVEEMLVPAGETTILVDVSGSMNQPLSGKSDLTRMDAAAALAVLWPGKRRLWTFSERLVEVAPRRGMAGIEAIKNSQMQNRTFLGRALTELDPPIDHRLIVITDEQSHDPVPQPAAGSKAYLINVASAVHGVGYGNWTHLDGFSEHVIRWIMENEKEVEPMEERGRPTPAGLRTRVNLDRAPHGEGGPGSFGYQSHAVGD